MIPKCGGSDLIMNKFEGHLIGPQSRNFRAIILKEELEIFSLSWKGFPFLSSICKGNLLCLDNIKQDNLF